MDISDLLENLLSVFHVLNKDWLFRFQSRKHRKSCQRNIKRRWYSPDLLICLICALHLLLYCSQLFWPSLSDPCDFGFRSSYFGSEGMLIADGTDWWLTATIPPFLPTQRWPVVRALVAGESRRQVLPPQQSLPDEKMLYSSLLKHWK